MDTKQETGIQLQQTRNKKHGTVTTMKQTINEKQWAINRNKIKQKHETRNINKIKQERNNK